jgi:beta-lactam-binding protein with PASTA domain
VPNVVHRTQGAAVALIEGNHLKAAVIPVTIPGIEPGWVYSQSVNAGAQEKWGFTVVISVEQPISTTTTTTTTPSISGISGITP